MTLLLLAAVIIPTFSTGEGAQISQAPAADAAAASLYFPPAGAGWATISAREAGWNAGALEEVLTWAGEARSSGIVMLHRGRILAERYWPHENPFQHRGRTPDGRTIEDVSGVQRGITSILIGIAVDRGLLQREAPVSTYLGTGWSRAPLEAERRITIQHLLSMTSGLTYELEYKAPAGERFDGTGPYKEIVEVLGRVAGKDINTISAQWLTSPLGMQDNPRWIVHNEFNPYAVATTARDLARFGLLILARGVWDGKRIVSEAYVRDALRPSQSFNPSYGLLWYLNSRQGSFSIPQAPTDLVAGRGAANRRLYVVPSLQLVIARLGDAARRAAPKVADDEFFEREFWARVVKALPANR